MNRHKKDQLRANIRLSNTVSVQVSKMFTVSKLLSLSAFVMVAAAAAVQHEARQSLPPPFAGTHSGDGTLKSMLLKRNSYFQQVHSLSPVSVPAEFSIARAIPLLLFLPRCMTRSRKCSEAIDSRHSKSLGVYSGATANPNLNPICQRTITATCKLYPYS